MNISLSIFDVFANVVPGSLYLVVSIYVGIRFGWIDTGDLAGLDTTLALVGGLVAAYLLGQILGANLRWLVERLPLWRWSTEQVRAEFRRRNPTVATRPFVDADPFTLLAGLRQVSPDAAIEVDRSRAAGLMMRNATPALLIGALSALVEAAVSTRLAPAVVAVALVGLAVLSQYEGHKRARWALIHTYECAVWLPNVDTALALPPATTPVPAGSAGEPEVPAAG
jgi:hypothetical protein